MHRAAPPPPRRPLPPLRARLPVQPRCGRRAHELLTVLESVSVLASTNATLIHKNFELADAQSELQLVVTLLQRAYGLYSARKALEYALETHDATDHDGLVRYLKISSTGAAVLACLSASSKVTRDNGGNAHTRETLATLLLDALAWLNAEYRDRRSAKERVGEPVIIIPRVLSFSQRRVVTCLLQKVGFRVDEAAAVFKEVGAEKDEEEEEPALPPSPLYKKVAAAEAAKAAAAEAEAAAAELEEAVAAASAAMVATRAAAAEAAEAAAAAKAAAAASG